MTDHVYAGVSTVFSAFCVSIHFPRLFPPRLYLFLVLSVSSFDFRLLLSKNDRRIYIPCNSILISCHGCVLLSGSLSRWLFCISPAVVARCARPAPRHGVGSAAGRGGAAGAQGWFLPPLFSSSPSRAGYPPWGSPAQCACPAQAEPSRTGCQEWGALGDGFAVGRGLPFHPTAPE